MNKKFFLDQVNRLRTQWKYSYGQERTERLWTIWSKTSDPFFSEMVDIALDRYRSAPMLEDFADIERIVIAERDRNRSQVGGRGYGEILSNAARYTKANREFVSQCLKLLDDKWHGRITGKHFNQGCDYLDEASKLIMEDRFEIEPHQGYVKRYCEEVIDKK